MKMKIGKHIVVEQTGSVVLISFKGKRIGGIQKFVADFGVDIKEDKLKCVLCEYGPEDEVTTCRDFAAELAREGFDIEWIKVPAATPQKFQPIESSVWTRKIGPGTRLTTAADGDFIFT